jgi:hypothetical protein
MQNYTNDKKFMSKENIQRILNAFTAYMEDTQNIVFQTDEITELKKLVFSIMNSVSTKNPDVGDIHKLNIQVLTVAKDHFVKQNKSKPNIKNLEREKEIFGDRKISVNEIVPQRDPYVRKTIPDLDKFITERDQPYRKNLPDVTSIVRQVTEVAENSDDFIKKLQQLETDRSKVDTNIQQSRMSTDNEFRVNNTLENQDPKQLYTMKDDERFKSEYQKTENLNIDNLEPRSNSKKSKGPEDNFSTRQNLIIENKSTKPKMILKKYLSINSIDREWERSMVRYSYAVTFNGNSLSGNYKNIRSIEVGKVVIPEEICENINSINYPNKTQFNHEFSFSFPYLILRIDEFNDVYDGTNDNVRKSFCKLVFHRSYKAPNGRGYVILKPFQNEKKYFYPSPLSTLSRLTISLLKPNGFLVNESSDSYKIFKLDYDPFNPNCFNVVSDVFFDKNEFFVGDVVLFKGFEITSINDSIHSKMINDFMNRPEGHEVTQIGSTNNNGFYRSFYITAIGDFDKFKGKFNTDLDTISCLNLYNDTIDYNTYTGFNGYILNTSLQNTIGMKLDVLVNDMSEMETTLI